MHREQPMCSAEQFWESRYRQGDRIWSGEPNSAVVAETTGLSAGRALDLGCGEGADAIWLAAHGWNVTGVDVSATAVERARAEAQSRSLDEVTRFLRVNLADWEPDGGSYDLVVASFLHSPVELPRSLILRRIAAYVRTGGHLLVVSHAAPPPWFDVDQHPGHRFIGPDQDFAEMSLPEREWRVTVAETRSRIATGPSGEEAELLDGVLLLQRQR